MSTMKQDNIHRSNVDRIFHGYNHQHPYHPYNPYEHSQMGMGMNPMYIPSYGHHQDYNMKVGGGSAEQGYGNYGSYYPSGSENGPAVHGGHSGGYVHQSTSRHKKKGQSTALSALTLLAFLFFLNLLQNCLKEHMMSMNPTVMVMTAGVSKEGHDKIARLKHESRLMFDDDEDYFKLNKTVGINNEDDPLHSKAPKLQQIFSGRVKLRT